MDDEKFETDALQREEEQNADWMWDMQKTYADLEREMTNLDARRSGLKKSLIELEDKNKMAERLCLKEQHDVDELKLNGKCNQPTNRSINQSINQSIR